MKVTLERSCAYDLDVINAARVSLDRRSEWLETSIEDPEAVWADHEWVKLREDDKALLGWLMRKRHGSPFEHGYFKFHVEAPIFVFREWHRHRVGHSYNEMSGRYTELEDQFYQPKAWRTQTGKPGAYTYEEITNKSTTYVCDAVLDDIYERCWSAYQALLRKGVAKEQARCVLPVGIYSQMIWSCNPRSLMHFLSLRNAPDAQQEIRELAEQVEFAFQKFMPVTAAAFVQNGRRAP